MNRILLIVVCFLLLNDVYAQSGKQSSSAHEFFVGGGFGLSSLQYKIKEGNHKSRLGGNACIGYSYKVSPEFGLSTGVEISFFSAQCDMNVLSSEQAVTGSEGDFIFKTSYADYYETQTASYLNIPVMVLYKTQSPTAFYGMAGVKIGFPISAKYKGLGNLVTSAFFEFENQEYNNMPDRSFGSFDNVGGNTKLKLDMNFSLSIEAGMEFSLSDNLALSSGIFLDYGLMDIIKDNKNQQLVKYHSDSSSNLAYNSIFHTQYMDKVNTLVAGIKLCIGFKF